jgi:hypothetical protein
LIRVAIRDRARIIPTHKRADRAVAFGGDSRAKIVPRMRRVRKPVKHEHKRPRALLQIGEFQPVRVDEMNRSSHGLGTLRQESEQARTGCRPGRRCETATRPTPAGGDPGYTQCETNFRELQMWPVLGQGGHASPTESWHSLSPRDMSFEAKRFRHVAVAIPEMRVSRGIAVSPRQ